MKLPSKDKMCMLIKGKRKEMWQFIKIRAWYIVLLVVGSAYIWHYRFEIYQLKELNAQNLIFILWLLLLFWPLISEMEFLGVKVKKEVEKATEEVKDNIHAIQTQIANLHMSNTAATNIYLGDTFLPSEKKITELSQRVHNKQVPHSNENSSVSNTKDMYDENDVYLFKVRREIEITLRELCEKIGYSVKIHEPILRMLQILMQAEVIDGMTCDLISQVVKIADRGVHGEIVSNKYITKTSHT